MKIRHGFVSNSSSTSFCIYGTWLNKEVDYDDPNRWEWVEKAEEALYETTKGLDISYYVSGECESIYVGRKFDKMKLDETRREFQERTKQDIKNVMAKIPEILPEDEINEFSIITETIES